MSNDTELLPPNHTLWWWAFNFLILASSILDIMEGSCVVLMMFIMDVDVVHGAEIVS